MILVTGGAGYIGSHTCVELIEKGYEVVVVDNFSNSKPEVIDRIKKITGKEISCVNADVCDKNALEEVFKTYDIDAVIHFAGFKAVGESVQIPLSYYRNNIDSTLSLCEVMNQYNVHNIIFSSSATVYRSDNESPISEDSELGCTNPYGWTKYMIEQILKDLSVSDNRWSVILLRYFNPIGAHKSGLIGEKPNGIPNNLLPYVSQTAAGRREKLHVFGNDYPTKDGTGVRDYIHVVDLAKGHVCALNYIYSHKGVDAVNLGTGNGYSVLEIVSEYEKATGKKIPYVIDGRRAGDIAECYANPAKAKKMLNWQSEYGIKEMCADSWNFEKNNIEK